MIEMKEIIVRYRDCEYVITQIGWFRHILLLNTLSLFLAYRLKFIPKISLF